MNWLSNALNAIGDFVMDNIVDPIVDFFSSAPSVDVPVTPPVEMPTAPDIPKKSPEVPPVPKAPTAPDLDRPEYHPPKEPSPSKKSKSEKAKKETDTQNPEKKDNCVEEEECGECEININKFLKCYKNKHFMYDRRQKKYIKFRLNTKSEQALRKLISRLVKHYSNTKECNLKKISYMLATAKLEAYNYRKQYWFYPISELGGNKYAQDMYDPILGKTDRRRKVAKQLGNIYKGDGVKYKGRGFVQITGRANYEKFSKILGKDFANNPDSVLDWEHSFKIMVIGMEKGIFTGRKLSDYITKEKADYYNARKIINGLNEATHISKYAKDFEACLKL